MAINKPSKKKVSSEEELEELISKQAAQARRYQNCSHSFNDDGQCEYCGIDEEYYMNSDRDDLGKYE